MHADSKALLLHVFSLSNQSQQSLSYQMAQRGKFWLCIMHPKSFATIKLRTIKYQIKLCSVFVLDFTIDSWVLRVAMCFWYEAMMQSRLHGDKCQMDNIFPSVSLWVLVCFISAYLLVMPPPGGSPGISSSVRNLITSKRSGSSSLDRIILMISENKNRFEREN